MSLPILNELLAGGAIELARKGVADLRGCRLLNDALESVSVRHPRRARCQWRTGFDRPGVLGGTGAFG